ncbi:MAG: c-type cytochrome [Planctomycetia bacterium]|nr:c-type cytochrome [Planctomycetia bacterium]
MRWLLFLLVFIPQASAADKPVPTKDAAAKMTVPPGFNVTLFAGEPDIVQPIAFTFDDRGRMWVVECFSYPKWSRDGKGKDRVVCLEDVDGDGKHDKKTVVIDNGVNLSGIEWGFGGVWLCSSPNLLFVPIENDKPGTPVVMLDGWNMTDTKHNVFNSLIWGPDGWLYGCNGIQSKSYVGAPGTPKEKRTYCDACVWKFHPTRKNFEVVATGTTNPWGLDFDEHGEMFITNCVIDHLFHVVPGGRYQRMYGQDPNPYAFDLMKSAVDYKHWAGGHWTESRADQKTGALRKDHDDAGGGHAHSGCAIYLGDNFPKEYRNTLFTCNIHGSRLNNDGLERTPSGMKGVRRPDFLFANDPWFRGICVKQGPEGALYVSDWTDTGECHNYDVADTSNGRIYRVAYGAPKKFVGDVSKMTKETLREAALSSNEWLSRKARRILQERTAAGEPLQTLYEGIPVGNYDDRKLIRQVWAQVAVNGIGPAHIQNGIGQVPAVRGWLMRYGLENPKLADVTRQTIANYSHPDPMYRRDQAVVLANYSAMDSISHVTKLFSHVEDNADTKLTQLYWLGIQPAVLAKPDEALKLVNSIAIRRVRTNIVRLVTALPNTEPTKQLDAIFPILASAPSDEVKQDILRGIALALEDRKAVTPPTSWKAIYEPLARSTDATLRESAHDLALKFGDPQAVFWLMAQATNDKLPQAARVRAVEKLLPVKPKYFSTALQDWLEVPALRGAAIRGLASYADETIPTAILKRYADLPAEEKADAILTLASRPKFALALLDAIEKGSIPKADIGAFAARQIVALNNKDVTAKLAAVWGTVKAANATRVEQTKKIKALLSPEYLKSANAEKGKALYAKSCAACHKLFGEGGDVGPELTGSQRANLDYILENVLDPNTAVPFDYKMVQFNLLDGRVVTGLVKKETAAAVTVRTANEQIVIAKEDIEKRTPTNNSVMPEGLLDTLKDEEIRDLIAYLQKK